MKVFVVDLKDQPGEVARLTETIAAKGINIESMAGIASGGRGAVALLTHDDRLTREAVREMGLDVREIEAVVAVLEHRPGSFAETARKIADAGINVTVVLPVTIAANTVGVALATDDPPRVKELLGSTERTRARAS